MNTVSLSNLQMSGAVSDHGLLERAASTPDAKSVFARWMIAVALTLAVFMDALNGALFNMARPQITGDLAATLDESAWFNLAYLIAKVACLPASAWLVNRFGGTRICMHSVIWLVASSIFSTLDLSLDALIVARIVQGAAGAALLVSAQTILLHIFPRQQQGLVQALFAVGVVMAPTTLAPAIQGWLTEVFSWKWVFGINLGIASVTIFILAFLRSHLPNISHRVGRFNYIGFVLFTLSVATVIYVILEGPRWNWLDDSHIVTATILSTVICLTTVAWFLRAREKRSIIGRDIFFKADFTFGFCVSFIAGFVMFGSAFLIPAFALNVLALTPSETGFMLLPSCLSLSIGLLTAGLLFTEKNLNPLKLVPLGVLLTITAMWMLSLSSLNSGPDDLWSGLLIRGIGLGILFLAVTMITLSDLKSEHMASGVALFNVGRQMGGIISISFLSTYLNKQIAQNRLIMSEHINPANLIFQDRLSTLTNRLVLRGLDPGVANESAAALIQVSVKSQVAVTSFNNAFFSIIVLFVIAIPLIILLKELIHKVLTPST